MIFIETTIFTRLVQNLLTDDEYRELQRTLMNGRHWPNNIKKTRKKINILMVYIYPKGKHGQIFLQAS